MFKKIKTNKKGFTLAELLIVVAIIGVLVAISIPIFTSQLEKAREATDLANVRSKYAEAVADYLTNPEKDTKKYTVNITSDGTKADTPNTKVAGVDSDDILTNGPTVDINVAADGTVTIAGKTATSDAGQAGNAQGAPAQAESPVVK